MKLLGWTTSLPGLSVRPSRPRPVPLLRRYGRLKNKFQKKHPIFGPNCWVVSRGNLRFSGLLSGGRLPNALPARAPIFLAAAYRGERVVRNSNTLLCAPKWSAVLRVAHPGISWKKCYILNSDKRLLFFSPKEAGKVLPDFPDCTRTLKTTLTLRSIQQGCADVW